MQIKSAFVGALLIAACSLVMTGQGVVVVPNNIGASYPIINQNFTWLNANKGAAAIACAATPGDTTGAYRQQCQTTAGALYVCNNAAGCTVAGDWVLTGPTTVLMNCSGDITSTLQTQITAFGIAGGTINLSAGTCNSTAKPVFFLDATTPVANQGPIRIIGAGAYHFWTGATPPPPSGGTILELRYSDATALIDTRGAGELVLEHLTLWSATAGATFIQTTNTVLLGWDVTILGDPAKSGTTTDQTGVVFGGTTDTAVGMASNSPFTGYGSKWQSGYFNRLKIDAYLRRWANGVIISDNGMGFNDGAGATGARIIIDGGATAANAQQNVIRDNTMEMVASVYGVHIVSGINNQISGGFYDVVASTVALVLCDAGSTANNTFNNYLTVPTPPTVALLDVTPSANQLIQTSAFGLTSNKGFYSSTDGNGLNFFQEWLAYSQSGVLIIRDLTNSRQALAFQAGTSGNGVAYFDGKINPGTSHFAALGTGGAGNGSIINCDDCDAPASPGAACSSAAAKAGATAIKSRGAWLCY